MSKKKNQKTRQELGNGSGRLLVWATVLALVFSAGLITGQRLISRQNTPSLVSVTASGVTENPTSEGGDDVSKKVPSLSFSFYEKLSPQAAKVPVLPKSKSKSKSKKKSKKKSSSSASKSALAQGGDKLTSSALPARYTLQVGAHPSMDKAKKQLSKLREKGLEPHIIAVESSGQAKLYRVRVGKFHTMDEARHFQGELKQSRDVATFVTPL